MASPFNPLDHPVLFSTPKRLLAFSSCYEQLPFAMLLVDLLRPRVIVELGTYYGESFCACCQAVQELALTTRSYAIGTWLSDPPPDSFGKSVLADLRAHHDALYSKFSRLIPASGEEALSEIADGAVDLLHIIANSRNHAASYDPQSWLPKLSVRGVIWLDGVKAGLPGHGLGAFQDKLKLRYPYFELGDSAGTHLFAVGAELPQVLQDSLVSQDLGKLRDFLFYLGQSRSEQRRAYGLTVKTLKQQSEIVKLQLRVEGLLRDSAMVQDERTWLKNQLQQMERTRIWQLGALYWRLHARLRARFHPPSAKVALNHRAEPTAPVQYLSSNSSADDSGTSSMLLQPALPVDAYLLVATENEGALQGFAAQVSRFPPRGTVGESAEAHAGDATIIQLEALRAQCAAFLAVPRTMLSWLHGLPLFEQYLVKHFPLVSQQAEDWRIYDLGQSVVSVDPRFTGVGRRLPRAR